MSNGYSWVVEKNRQCIGLGSLKDALLYIKLNLKMDEEVIETIKLHFDLGAEVDVYSDEDIEFSVTRMTVEDFIKLYEGRVKEDEST